MRGRAVSRGPGKWQRAILDALTEHDYFYLIDLLPVEYDRNEYKALYRAAYQLYRAGKIGMQCFTFGTTYGGSRLCITRRGVSFNVRTMEGDIRNKKIVRTTSTIDHVSHHPIESRIVQVKPRLDIILDQIDKDGMVFIDEDASIDDGLTIDGTWRDPD